MAKAVIDRTMADTYIINAGTEVFLPDFSFTTPNRSEAISGKIYDASKDGGKFKRTHEMLLDGLVTYRYLVAEKGDLAHVSEESELGSAINTRQYGSATISNNSHLQENQDNMINYSKTPIKLSPILESPDLPERSPKKTEPFTLGRTTNEEARAHSHESFVNPESSGFDYR